MKINYFLLLVGLIVGASFGKRKHSTDLKAVYADKKKEAPN
ncbi:hypothetical protein [Flavobacterium sp. HSC-61S13]|nr:hypothetical protein [Flavobacterium sp. HSC-61S13]MCP1996166.1 hypothetical protein [Flavobacterium sp. HSC-61S13]